MNRNAALSVIGVVLIMITMFSGCIDQYYNVCNIEGSGIKATIQETKRPIRLKITGEENDITIDKNVELKDVYIDWGFNNNTIRLYGEPQGNITSTWEPHNCTTNLGEETNQIVYYGGK